MARQPRAGAVELGVSAGFFLAAILDTLSTDSGLRNEGTVKEELAIFFGLMVVCMSLCTAAAASLRPGFFSKQGKSVAPGVAPDNCPAGRDASFMA